MATLDKDFRAARQRVTQLLNTLPTVFDSAQTGVDQISHGFDDIFRAYDHRGAQMAMDGHELMVAVVDQFVGWARGAAEEIEEKQAPWMAACSAYLRKAKRYWRGESGASTASVKREPDEVAAASTSSVPAEPELNEGPYASWTEASTDKIVVRKRGEKQPLHTFVRLPQQQTTEFGDLNVFEPEVPDIGKDVSMIRFFPPSQDVLLRVAYKDGLERWIVVATHVSPCCSRGVRRGEGVEGVRYGKEQEDGAILYRHAGVQYHLVTVTRRSSIFGALIIGPWLSSLTSPLPFGTYPP